MTAGGTGSARLGFNGSGPAGAGAPSSGTFGVSPPGGGSPRDASACSGPANVTGGAVGHHQYTKIHSPASSRSPVASLAAPECISPPQSSGHHAGRATIPPMLANSRSNFRDHTIGAATATDEYVPTISPVSRQNANARIPSPP
jgi:hypothetical protein